MNSTTDTFSLQAESLLQFMVKLGYTPARSNGGFETHLYPANSIVSTRTAIKLHNLTKDQWLRDPDGSYVPGNLPLKLRLNAYGVNNVLAAKFVHQVKLTPCRNSSNGIKMPKDEGSHLIKLVDESYGDMFGL